MSLRSESNELIEKARAVKSTHDDIKERYNKEWPRKKIKVKNQDKMYDEIKSLTSRLDTTHSQVSDKLWKMKDDLSKKQYLYDNLPESSKNDDKNKTVIAYKKQQRLVEDISSIKDELHKYLWDLKSLRDAFLDRTEEDTGLNLKINIS